MEAFVAAFLAAERERREKRDLEHYIDYLRRRLHGPKGERIEDPASDATAHVRSNPSARASSASRASLYSTNTRSSWAP